VVSFLIGSSHPYDVGTILDRFGIAVRTGHHCTQPLMKRYGIPGTVRASFAFYNTREEVDRLTEAVGKAARMLA
jgi:cysteine desulfurase/selenocysteine lyase